MMTARVTLPMIPVALTMKMQQEIRMDRIIPAVLILLMALVIPATTEVILVIPLILPEVTRSLTLPMTPRTTARIFQTTPRMLPLTMDRKTALYGRTPPPEARITEEIHLAKILSIMNDM